MIHGPKAADRQTHNNDIALHRSTLGQGRPCPENAIQMPLRLFQIVKDRCREPS